MNKLFEIEKIYRELVWAPDEDEAWVIFRSHERDMESADDSISEYKTVQEVLDGGHFYGDTIPWGAPDNVDVRDLFDERDRELWAGRVPVYIVVDDDVGCNLTEAYCGLVRGDDGKDLEDEDVGRVVYLLADGSQILETRQQRDGREIDDKAITIQIEEEKLFKLMQQSSAQMKLVQELKNG